MSDKITITIQGLFFDVPTKYAEGYTLSANEARALDILRSSNLRNNFATKVKEAKEAVEKELGADAEIPAQVQANLQTEFAALAESYEFSTKRLPKAPLNPVQATAEKIAKEMILAALRQKGKKPADLEDGVMENLIATAIEKKPEIMEEAKRRVQALQSAGEDLLGTV